MSAPFRLDGWTFSSTAFDVLADVAGYNAHEARGRWARAGSEATERQSCTFNEASIRALFGPRGVEALLAAELAERVDDGLRLLEMEGGIEWYGGIKEKRRRAGRARADKARAEGGRGQGGRFVAQHASTPPAHAGVLVQHSTSTPPPSTSSPAPDPIPDPIPEKHTYARARHPSAGRIASAVWNHCAKAQGGLRAENVAVPSWPSMHDAEHPGWAALLDRVCELLVGSTETEAKAVAMNRVDVAAAKARDEGDGNWFTPQAMFTRKSFEAFSRLDPAQFTRKSRNQRETGFAAVMRIAQEEA